MLAPSRLPPWVIIEETRDKVFRTSIGPQETPCVVLILSPLGRNLDKANPVPPPNF